MTAPDELGGGPGGGMESRRLAIALVLLFAVGGIWGLTYSLAKLVTEAGAHPFGLTLLQGLIGAAIMLPYALLRGRRIVLDREHLVFYIVAGALGTALPSIVIYSAAPHIPAGILSILTTLVPLLTYSFALGLGIERFAGLRAFGIVLGLTALLMIIVPDASLPSPAMVGWVLFAILMPACYASENVFIAVRRPDGSDAGALLCGMLAAGAAMTLPLVWLTDTWTSLALPWGVTEWLILAMVAINVVAYLMFLELVRLTGPVFAAQAAYVVTVSGVFWAMVIFGETHSAWVWGAMLVMFGGLALVNPRPAIGRAHSTAGDASS